MQNAESSNIFQDLWAEDEDKNKDLRSKDEDKDLLSWSPRILEDEGRTFLEDNNTGSTSVTRYAALMADMLWSHARNLDSVII